MASTAMTTVEDKIALGVVDVDRAKNGFDLSAERSRPRA
jgi:hypothetical protein